MWAIPVSAAVLLAMLWPLSWSSGDDNFPFSSHPSFSAAPLNDGTVPLVVATSETGERRVLTLAQINQGGDTHTADTLHATLATPESAMELCTRVADTLLAPETTVHVELARFAVRGYFERDWDGPNPWRDDYEVERIATCDVGAPR